MQSNFLDQLPAMQFDHPWLSEDFAEVSREQAVGSNSRDHHYVPFFYLKRWAVEMEIQPVVIDSTTSERPKSPRQVGYLRHFYSLPKTDETMDLPLKWIEKHLSRIESPCAERLRQLDQIKTGKTMDAPLKRDLSVFLGLQRTRTPSHREYSMAIIKGPLGAKQELVKRMNPTLTGLALAAAMQPNYADDRLEAFHLMFSDVRNVIGKALFQRRWAVYETATPIITCDDPVIALAGPPSTRSSFVGFQKSAVVIYPLDPFHILVMLRADLKHRGPFKLDEEEAESINLEIAASATKTTFERVGDNIAKSLNIPIREITREISEEDFANLDHDEAIRIILNQGTPRSRWASSAQAPDWPVPRWYK
ncbi:DUF4238 domain-containing protein [Nocardia fluminea]|uniref:DUF4238 domain-containing protein n=1 Tax=Nocardia fluminea TaxID=134984 RepID=UPI00365DB304